MLSGWSFFGFRFSIKAFQHLFFDEDAVRHNLSLRLCFVPTAMCLVPTAFVFIPLVVHTPDQFGNLIFTVLCTFFVFKFLH